MVLILTFIAGQSSEPSFINDIISSLGLAIFCKHVGSEQVIRKNIAAIQLLLGLSITLEEAVLCGLGAGLEIWCQQVQICP